jgi:hypothetical protein
MASIAYDVEMIRQEMNPICWIASCAMAKGYATGASVGVGEFTDGLDPSTSCIANLAGSWAECTDLMSQWGFQLYDVAGAASGDMTADALLAALGQGPIVLLHLCAGFPYGAQYGVLNFTSSDAHAVVLTAIDTDAGTAAFNNPWGDKDQPCALDALVAKINADQAVGKTLAYYSG